MRAFGWKSLREPVFYLNKVEISERRGCTKRPGERAGEAKSEAGNMVE
jgi:hypothetical protein